jgi:hypothetical protein
MMSRIILNINTCLTGTISRLYSRPELVEDVLGAKLSDLPTPLADLVIAADTEELVSHAGSTKACGMYTA